MTRFLPGLAKNKDAKLGSIRDVGAFLVSAELKNGNVAVVKITSEKGGNCPMQNHWSGTPISI